MSSSDGWEERMLSILNERVAVSMYRETVMRLRVFCVLFCGAGLLVAMEHPALAQIQIPAAGSSPYVENFNGMGTTATETLPSPFRVDKNDTTVRAVGTYAGAGTATERAGGTSLATNAGNGIYNFGATADSTDRAVGFLAAGTATKSGNLYTLLHNPINASLPGVVLSYDIEKYRQGSNAAGFQVQLYYSTDGTSWNSAGGNFLTTFSADADNSGYNPAPGVTSSVSNQTLPVNVPALSDLYLAFNYSVTSGTTTTNAPALAVDNFKVVGTPEPTSTLLFGGGAASLVLGRWRRRRIGEAASFLALLLGRPLRGMVGR
jgi:hypothetical protein